VFGNISGDSRQAGIGGDRNTGRNHSCRRRRNEIQRFSTAAIFGNFDPCEFFSVAQTNLEISGGG